MLGVLETIVIVYISEFSNRIEPSFQFSFCYFILLAPGETLFYSKTEIFCLVYPLFHLLNFKFREIHLK